MTTKLIRLTEIVKDGDGTKTQPALVPSDFIGKVTTGTLEKATVGGIHLLGKTETQQLTLIMLKNNVPVFVEESLEDIEGLFNEPPGMFAVSSGTGSVTAPVTKNIKTWQ